MSTKETKSASGKTYTADVIIDEIEVNAAITAQFFLEQAIDHAGEELDKLDATSQRNLPVLAASVVIAQAVVYAAERITDGCFCIADSLNNIARQIATANKVADPTASNATHEDR